MQKKIDVTSFISAGDSGPEIIFMSDSESLNEYYWQKAHQARVVKSRCQYCGSWSPEFDNCPHCGAPYLEPAK